MADETYRAGGDGQFETSPNTINIQGNIPPKFQQALKAVGEKKTSGAPVVTNAPKIRMQGSSNLENLISGLKRGTYEEIVLPSQGFFYDGTDGPTNGVLHIRAMTGEEEQILATPRHVRKGKAIDMIFQNCLQERYNTEAFLSIDRTFLLIWLRGISYGKDYEVEVKCPECNKKFNTAIDLDSLIKTCCPSKLSLSDVLPSSGYRFNYRLSRGIDEIRVQEHRDRNIREFGEAKDDDTLLYRTSLLIDDIEGLKDKVELMMLLKVLSVQDVSYIRNLTSDPAFGIDTKCQITCYRCMADFEVEMPMEANFFFPRQSRKKERMQS
jgi:phosphopantetheine adenylyltransferase